jgi:hypothetical protein
MIDKKQLKSVGYFNYLCSIITNDTRGTHEIKSMIAMAKAACNMKAFSISKLELNLGRN